MGYQDTGRETIQVRVSDQLKKEWLEVCNQKSINPSSLLRKYIREFVDENKKKG